MDREAIHEKLITNVVTYLSSLSPEERALFQNPDTRPIIVERFLITEAQKEIIYGMEPQTDSKENIISLPHIGSPNIVSKENLPRFIKESGSTVFTVSEAVAYNLDYEWCKGFRNENTDILFVVSPIRSERNTLQYGSINLPSVERIRQHPDYDRVTNALATIEIMNGKDHDLVLAYKLIFEVRSNEDLLQLLGISDSELTKFWAYMNRGKTGLNANNLDVMRYPLDIYEIRKALIYVRSKRANDPTEIHSYDKRILAYIDYAMFKLLGTNRRFKKGQQDRFDSIYNDIKQIMTPQDIMPPERAYDTDRASICRNIWMSGIGLFGEETYRTITASSTISEEDLRESIIITELHYFGLTDEVITRLSTYPFGTRQQPILTMDQIYELQAKLKSRGYITDNHANPIKGKDLIPIVKLKTRQALSIRINILILDTALTMVERLIANNNMEDARTQMTFLDKLSPNSDTSKLSSNQQKRYNGIITTLGYY